MSASLAPLLLCFGKLRHRSAATWRLCERKDRASPRSARAALTPGHLARLSLPGPSQLSTYTAPPLPTDPTALGELEDRLLASYRNVQHFEFLAPGRVTDLYARYRQLPDSLMADQKALISAVLCIGRMGELTFEQSTDGEKRMRPTPVGESREDITYFRLALDYLEEFGAASCTALCECSGCLKRRRDNADAVMTILYYIFLQCSFVHPSDTSLLSSTLLHQSFTPRAGNILAHARAVAHPLSNSRPPEH